MADHNKSLRALQLWHLVSLGLVPILYSVFRTVSEPEDASRRLISIIFVVSGGAWAACFAIYSLMTGEQDKVVDTLLLVYRRLMRNTAFVLVSSTAFTIVASGFLYELLRNRQVEFIANDNCFLLIRGQNPDGTPRYDEVGWLPAMKPVRFRIPVGHVALLSKALYGDKPLSPSADTIQPFWINLARPRISIDCK